jgi:hypothetical protein
MFDQSGMTPPLNFGDTPNLVPDPETSSFSNPEQTGSTSALSRIIPEGVMPPFLGMGHDRGRGPGGPGSDYYGWPDDARNSRSAFFHEPGVPIKNFRML